MPAPTMTMRGGVGMGVHWTRRQGDKETRRQGDKETRRQGDKETRRQGDKETRRQGDKETACLSPCLPVSLSPLLPVSLPLCRSRSRAVREVVADGTEAVVERLVGLACGLPAGQLVAQLLHRGHRVAHRLLALQAFGVGLDLLADALQPRSLAGQLRAFL